MCRSTSGAERVKVTSCTRLLGHSWLPVRGIAARAMRTSEWVSMTCGPRSRSPIGCSLVHAISVTSRCMSVVTGARPVE
jgi:hypothetical protein